MFVRTNEGNLLADTSCKYPIVRRSSDPNTITQIPSILPSLSLAVNASTLAFFASLVALELATVSYWFGWITVWRFMPAVAGGATLALLTGKSALGAKMRARLEEERRTGKVLKMG